MFPIPNNILDLEEYQIIFFEIYVAQRPKQVNKFEYVVHSSVLQFTFCVFTEKIKDMHKQFLEESQLTFSQVNTIFLSLFGVNSVLALLELHCKGKHSVSFIYFQTSREEHSISYLV